MGIHDDDAVGTETMTTTRGGGGRGWRRDDDARREMTGPGRVPRDGERRGCVG